MYLSFRKAKYDRLVQNLKSWPIIFIIPYLFLWALLPNFLNRLSSTSIFEQSSENLLNTLLDQILWSLFIVLQTPFLNYAFSYHIDEGRSLQDDRREQIVYFSESLNFTFVLTPTTLLKGVANRGIV